MASLVNSSMTTDSRVMSIMELILRDVVVLTVNSSASNGL